MIVMNTIIGTMVQALNTTFSKGMSFPSRSILSNITVVLKVQLLLIFKYQANGKGDKKRNSRLPLTPFQFQRYIEERENRGECIKSSP